MIPKLLHLIWVGDESRRPERCIRSWVDRHPDWTVRIWGNPDLAEREWFNAEHMKAMATREWNGVADMMRWEILFDQGGVLVDADSFCVQPLPAWLLECEAFACWENEIVRPGLIAAGYFGTVPRNPFLAQIIQAIKEKPTVVDRMAWESVGPQMLTETWRRLGYGNLTVVPSHFFIPRHFTGSEYTGTGPVYARQEWGSTLGRYDQLSAVESVPQPVGEAFLFEPAWKAAGWVEVLLSFLQAFVPEDPVSLVFVLDPAAPGQISLPEAESAVLGMIQRLGRERFPEIVLADQPGDLVKVLRRFPLACWVPAGSGSTEGLRGVFGARFAEARRKMTAR